MSTQTFTWKHKHALINIYIIHMYTGNQKNAKPISIFSFHTDLFLTETN